MHESGLSIVAGVGLGLILHYVMLTQTQAGPDKFESKLFFSFMLPLLVLSAGYNIHRRRFLRNIGTIFLYGVIGTIVCFLTVGVGAYFLSEAGVVVTSTGEVVHITAREALLLGAVLSASDVVCSLSLVKEDKTPRLHSILFGESIVNDAVGILLYYSLTSAEVETLDAMTVLTILGQFLLNCTTSIILGVVFGIIGS